MDPARVELEQGSHGGVGFGLCKPQRQQRIRTTAGRLKRERSTRGRRKREGEVEMRGGMMKLGSQGTCHNATCYNMNMHMMMGICKMTPSTMQTQDEAMMQQWMSKAK